ncbi:MAG: alpha/beta hydrolase, partial [Stenotrophomonas nitritireducens]|nr:alpha/beta hydrolase [Stenotrophomonas nitritireducens]
MSRKTRTLLAVAALVAVLGYRAFKPAPDEAKADKASPPVADAPARPLMLGRLAFQPCSLDSPASRDSLEAQCATFEVPEDRANPQGRRIALNIALLVPDKPEDVQPDPVFFLAGGPGQSAVDSYPMVDAAFADVRKHRNVILVDQRGTGRSNLLSCEAPEEDDASVEAMQASAAACAATLSKKADLRHYTTTDAVAD